MSAGRSAQHILSSIYFIVFFWFWFILVSLTTFILWLLQINRIKKIISRRKKKKVSVLYLEVFAPLNAGNKYRTSKWVDILNQNNFRARSKYVFEYNDYLQLTAQQETMIFFHIGFLWKRWWQCLSAIFYDIVIVRREILMFNDYGNLFFERLLFHINPHRLLDFDDDISAAKHEPRDISLFGKLLFEHPKKFSASLKYFSAFIPATNYLKELLLHYYPEISDRKVIVLPTCVDYDNYPPKVYTKHTEPITLGWAGTRGNLYHLNIVIPALNNLAHKYNFRLLVICNQIYCPNTEFEIENIPWVDSMEIENLNRIDIGLMPLVNSRVSKGKGGFKLIQYMGCGIVSMATGVTVNNEIVDDGVNGFLVPPDTDWTSYFEKVFAQRNSFSEIGKAAFQKVKDNYSFNANRDKLLNFLNEQVNY